MTLNPRDHRRRTLFVAGLAGGVLIVYVVLPVLRAVWVAHPARKPVCCQTPADFGLTYEDVTFTTPRGSTLRGWYIPSQNTATVIVTHGFGGNRIDVLAPAVALARQGFGVLAIDLPAHGESEGGLLTLTGEDVLAAVAYLQNRPEVDAARIGAWGFSLGGLVSLQAAAQTDALKAVVADGPFPVVTLADRPPPEGVADWLWLPFDWVQSQALALQGVSPAYSVVDALPRIAPRPVLLVAGLQNDGERRVLRRYAALAGETATLWEIAEAGHLGGWAARPDEYTQHVTTFFEQALFEKP